MTLIPKRPQPRSRAAVLLGWCLALTLCLLAFGVLATVALRPGVDAFDRSVTTQLHSAAGPTMDTVMHGVTSLGSTALLTALVGVGALVLLRRRDHAEAALLVTALVGTLVLNEALKVFFARPRPALDWAESVTGLSFPSGHAMNSFVVYVVLGLLILRWRGARVGVAALTLALVVATLVSISRIYLGVHWATDVAAGAVAGATYLLVLVPAWEVMRRD